MQRAMLLESDTAPPVIAFQLYTTAYTGCRTALSVPRLPVAEVRSLGTHFLALSASSL